MARRLRDSVVVITGASTGIGRAAALEFARCGAWVAIASRREAALQALARELEDAGGRALVCALDVTDEKAVNEMARRVVSTWGRVDTWVNNAAVTLFCRFEECPDDDFRRVMETNFFGVANGCRAVLPYFREQGEGVLINVSSMVGKVGSPFVSAYTASKFAIVGLTESIRGEVLDAPGVRVCAMLLGSIDTPLFQHAANYSGRQVKPLEPVLDVREAADAIVRCARRPRDEMRVGAATPMFVLHDLFPGWTSRQMARTVERRHFGEQTVGPQPGNLFQPMERYTSADGGWGGMRARRAAKAGAIGGLVGLGLLGAALLLADRGRVRAGFVSRALRRLGVQS